MTSILTLIGLLALIPALVIYSSFAWGYVAFIIYNWFILPVFPELPNLNFLQLAGIMFFVNCFIHSDLHHFKDEVKDNVTGSVVTILNPWLILFGAWIFKLFY